MKPQHMTSDEILRCAEPETDLEKALLSIVETIEGDVFSNYECEDCEGYCNQVDDLDVQVENLNDDVKEMATEITELKKLLDDNGIAYG